MKSGTAPAYPRRDSHHAHRVVRKMMKSVAMQEIGAAAFALVTCIAHTEDAKRYSGPVTFYNDQLMSILGLRTRRALYAARQKAIDAGWLHHEHDGTRSPGLYWSLIPEECASLADGPIDESDVTQEAVPANKEAATLGALRAPNPNDDPPKITGAARTQCSTPIDPSPKSIHTRSTLKGVAQKKAQPPLQVPEAQLGRWEHVRDKLARILCPPPKDADLPGMVAALVVNGVVNESDAMDAAEGVRLVKKPPDNRISYFWKSLKNRCRGADLNAAMRRVRLPKVSGQQDAELLALAAGIGNLPEVDA